LNLRFGDEVLISKEHCRVIQKSERYFTLSTSGNDRGEMRGPRLR
jgi:hypothetical protein